MSGCDAITVAKPSRKTGWSSTHRILIGAAELRGIPLGVDSNSGLGSMPVGPLPTLPYKGTSGLSLYKSAGQLLRHLRWRQFPMGMTLPHTQSRYWPDHLTRLNPSDAGNCEIGRAHV